MSYTLAYGRTYNEWIEERARRIRSYLELCYSRNQEINLFDFCYSVYHERLSLESPSFWRPYENQFQDFKPSPFIRNYLLFVIERLRELGFIKAQFELQITDSLTLSETFQEESTSSSNSNNQEIVRVIPHFFVVQIPSIEVLKSLSYEYEQIEEQLKEKISQITTTEQYEQFVQELEDYQI